MMKFLIRHSCVFIVFAAFCFSVKGCAIVNKKGSEYSFGEECSHCHGDYLEGNRNIRKECGHCHDEGELSPQEVKSENIKEIIMSEPHIHLTKNIFGSTPSCFNCHRQNDL